MGLLQNLAAVAIRNKVMANLRANCPEGIKNELETLLGNKEAVSVIQKFVTDAMKGGGKIQAEAVTTLPFPAEIQELLDMSGNKYVLTFDGGKVALTVDGEVKEI